MTATLDPRVTPARPDLAADHLRGVVDAPSFVAGTRHLVAAGSVPLRREPRDDLPYASELLHGEAFTVYDTDEEGWAWGQAEVDGYVGWLPLHALALGTAEAPTHKVVAQRTFVFPAPSIKHTPLQVLPFAARLSVRGDDGPFVRLGGGFVWRGHLLPVDSVAPDPVAVAEAFIGVPYLWGGRTSMGLDCSALVQLALAAAGRAAPRDSDMQERALGGVVSDGEPLRRGDLVFWRGHVGLMRDPDTLLHANGHSMSVCSEPLSPARQRILSSGGGVVTSVRRLGPIGRA